MEKEISVYQDFSPLAFGRDENDGPNSGKRFRNEFLIPIWDKYDKIKIDFTGFDASPGSSFLSSAFLELITKCNLSYDSVKKKIDIYPKESVYPSSVEYLLDKAKNYG